MSKEKEMIELINKHMPRSASQLNKLFESDSEIVQFQGKRLLYTMDEFSEEDLLRDNDPYVLGWNMAVGSISDILASGGKPKYYAHSLVIQKSWSQDYVSKLSQGIAQVLKEVGAAFIGGDFGTSKTWRYTGSVIGELEGEPLLRSGAKVGDGIYVTGPIGGGNIEAALVLYGKNPYIKHLTGHWKKPFQLRTKEAELIKRHSCCCIDTSDGIFNALNSISEMSETGFVVSDLPYIESGVFLAKGLNLPEEVLFLGECGEYELLFTLSKEGEEEFLNEAQAKKLKFYKLGEVKEQGSKSLWQKDREIDLAMYDLSARDFSDPKDYLRAVANFLK
ncbi:thiamine-phosphate kinase [Desulfosporosinus fructosivorans]